MGWGRVAIEKTIRGAVSDPVLHVAVPPGTEYRLGRRQHVARHRTATFVAPGWEFTRRSPRGSLFAISVSRRKLAEEIEARRPGGRGAVAFKTCAIELSDVDRSKLVSAVADFARSSGPAADRLQRVRSEAQIIGALADLLVEESAVHRAQAVAMARIADLEVWIEEHVNEPITVGRLCNVAGVGERALQKAFEARRGLSPMRFVAERRLAEAHRRLTSAGSGDDVTRVAVSLGFGNTGRFARLYRLAFGESPSQSLRRALR